MTACHKLRITTKLILNLWGHKKFLNILYLFKKKQMWEGLKGTTWEEIPIVYQISVWVKSLAQGGFSRGPERIRLASLDEKRDTWKDFSDVRNSRFKGKNCVRKNIVYSGSSKKLKWLKLTSKKLKWLTAIYENTKTEKKT